MALREALTRQREQAWQNYPAGERAAAIMGPRQITAFKVFEDVIYSRGSQKEHITRELFRLFQMMAR